MWYLYNSVMMMYAHVPTQAAHELEAASLRGTVSAAQETAEELRAQGEEQARAALAAQQALQERLEQLQTDFASLDTSKGQCLHQPTVALYTHRSSAQEKLCLDIARRSGLCEPWHASHLHISGRSSTLASESGTWVAMCYQFYQSMQCEDQSGLYQLKIGVIATWELVEGSVEMQIDCLVMITSN